jgi:hypothetical protein
MWSAVVYDIMSKVVALSGLGDSRVAEVHARLISIQAQENMTARITMLMALEDDAIEIVHSTMRIVSDAEAQVLESLRMERHRCAHPSFDLDGEAYSPSYEQAVAHITSALRFVLLRAPLEGNYAVERASRLIASRSFPTSRAQARIVLEDHHHVGRLGSSALRNLVLKLSKGLMDGAEELRGLGPQVHAGLAALAEFRGEGIRDCIESLRSFLGGRSDAVLLRYLSLCGNAPVYTQVSTPAVVVRLRGIVEAGAVADLGAHEVVGGVLQFPDLLVPMTERLQSMNSTDRGIVMAGGVHPALADLVIDTLSESPSWGFTESFVGQVLNEYVPLFALAQFERLFLGARLNKKWGGYNQVLGTSSGAQAVRDAMVECSRRFGAEGDAVVAAFRQALGAPYESILFPEEPES